MEVNSKTEVLVFLKKKRAHPILTYRFRSSKHHFSAKNLNKKTDLTKNQMIRLLGDNANVTDEKKLSKYLTELRQNNKRWNQFYATVGIHQSFCLQHSSTG